MLAVGSRGAGSGHGITFQPGPDGDVTLKVAATAALDGDPRCLGPNGRGTDDNTRYLHQVGHVIRLPRYGERRERGEEGKEEGKGRDATQTHVAR